MIQTVVQHFGTVDLLVNNASITKHIPMDDLEARRYGTSYSM